MEKQFNVCSRNGRCYEGENAALLERVQRKNNYRTGSWITFDQVVNKKGNYLWHGVSLLKGAKGTVIEKPDRNGDGVIYTTLYNVDQTNFEAIYPGVIDVIARDGVGINEAVQLLLKQPLQPEYRETPMLDRAMATGKQEPKGFWKRIAAVL